MPSLIAFNRKWNIGSDDFVFPELTEAFIRITWVAFTISVFVFHFPLSCPTQNLNGYLLGILSINCLTILLASLTAFVSARGTIMDSNPRKLIPTLIYFRCPVFLIEIAVTVLATVHVFKSIEGDEGCHFTTIVRITVLLEWILIMTAIIGLFIVFHLADNEVDDNTTITESSWSKRMKIFKIGQDDSMREALDEVATLISSYFVDTDLVFSDVVAGLLLMVHSRNNQYPPIKDKEFNPENNLSWMNLKDAEYYLHHASCVYGWPSYLFYNCRPKYFYRLFKKLQCCGKLRCEESNNTSERTRLRFDEENDRIEMKKRKNGGGGRNNSGEDEKYQGRAVVVEDNCCYCNTAAVVLSNEQKNLDLVFMSFRNHVYEVPFAVIADHDKKSIVVTIRGSCSLNDLVTDLSLEDDVMAIDIEENHERSCRSENVRVHRGMLKSAKYVHETIEKRKILEDLFVVHEDYTLVVCGHSLGAGVGSLLTMLLKNKYPNVRCYAFATPPCVSACGQEMMEKHVMSIVAGDDIISRTSYQSMSRLREKVLNELEVCKRAKYEIMIHGIYQLIFKSPWEEEETTTIANQELNSQDSSLLKNVNDYGGVVRLEEGGEGGPSTSMERRLSVMNKIQLYVPGRVMYVTDAEEHVPISKWIDPNCLSDIKLSVSVFSDHMPARISKLVKSTIDHQEVPIVTEQPI